MRILEGEGLVKVREVRVTYEYQPVNDFHLNDHLVKSESAQSDSEYKNYSIEKSPLNKNQNLTKGVNVYVVIAPDYNLRDEDI